jgi:hypothetical protein
MDDSLPRSDRSGPIDDYGLETPFATVIFFAKNRAHSDTIHVGDKTPTSTSCYARLGASDTVIVSREMTHNVMNKSLYHLREKNFVKFSAAAVDSFHVVGGDYDARLSRRDGVWWLNDPPARADNRLVEGYLNNLTEAIIREFVSEEKSELQRFGLDGPAKKIVLHHDLAETEIEFGDTEEDMVYVVRTGLEPVIKLEQKLIEAFRWTRDGLRARNLSFFEPGDIRTIRYETPDTSIVLERHPDGWYAGDRPVMQGRAEAFLRQLNSTMFSTILEEGTGDPFTRPGPFSIRITLLDGNGMPVDRIVLHDIRGPREEGASMSSGAVGRIESGGTEKLRLSIEGR